MKKHPKWKSLSQLDFYRMAEKCTSHKKALKILKKFEENIEHVHEE